MTSTDKNGWSGMIKEQAQVGDIAKRSRTTPTAHVERITAMTDDKDAIHDDEITAKATTLGVLVVKGTALDYALSCRV